MEEDWEKTIILIVTLLIVSGFYISPKIKEVNMNYHFALFIILFFICLIQAQYLKKWNNDKNKTDYTFVYYLYNLISVIIFLYLIYILGQNPSIKILKGGANIFNTDINQESIMNTPKLVLQKSISGLINGFTTYTNFWKRLIFRKSGDEIVEGIM